ncbi:hypothetical protein [Dongia deserti]|uniref:hypothetical protein n=1 Tax=Dongia deserti TaxID=2268030 RepID=UPI0013C46607|nr:hypothetical protein [Dongia deserti]
MHKLQHALDRIFGQPEAERAAQQPTDAFLDRERAFADTAKKIEALRQKRVSNPGLRPLPETVFEVVRHRGSWRILHRSKYSAPFADQAAAIAAAKELGRSKRALGYPVKILLRRYDGEIVPQVLDHDGS